MNKSNIFWAFIIIIVIASVTTFVFYASYIQLTKANHITLTAKVINVTVSDDDIDYINVLFDNNQTYRIYNGGVNKITDFTMHSKWIIELYQTYDFFSGYNNYWIVGDLIKVP